MSFRYSAELKMLFLGLFIMTLSAIRIDNNWLSLFTKVPLYSFWFWLFKHWFGERSVFRQIIDNLKDRNMVGVNSKGEIIEY